MRQNINKITRLFLKELAKKGEALLQLPRDETVEIAEDGTLYCQQ